MNRIIFILSLTLGALSITSCDKDNSLNDNPNFEDNNVTDSSTSQRLLKADFDGTEISFSTVTLVNNGGLEAINGN